MAVIAKYKFNSTLYADLVPEFNAEFTNYVVTDEATETDSEGNVIVTRIIEHDTLLPTLMRFGRVYVEGETTTDNRTDSLLEVLDMNTSELTSCDSMFRYNTNLTSISCEWDTSNVTDMRYMFYICNNLTSLDVSNFDTSKVTSMRSMFYSCNNLISLDVSNFDTSNATDMNNMFAECQKLTSLNLSNFDTSKVTRMDSMFYNCQSLTSLNISNWDTTNVTNMYYMFYYCIKLTSLDLSNFDTSNATNMSYMFYKCTNLISLDVSNWDTSKVTNMKEMFSNCQSLTSLDVSNFDTSNVTDMNTIFSNTPLLADIGMLYCSQSTINALSSNISTPSTNVWVEGSIIDDLTSYDNVTYKAYYWEKEILLNSPLLEGDKIVKKEGKIYHYHKMGMITFDGSEDDYGITGNNTTNSMVFGIELTNKAPEGKVIDNQTAQNIICNQFIQKYSPDSIYATDNIEGISMTDKPRIRILKSRLTTIDSEGIRQWFSENPTTVVYELANPYYELISDISEDLSLPLVSEDNIISNNSLIPTNMNIKNNGMSTVAMSTSTKYTVAFDKDADSSVTIDLCGSTIDTTDNVVEITTPSELSNDEITFIGDCEVSNVRILEGSVSGDAIPRESFEGLKSSFEDGYIPENLVDNFPGYKTENKVVTGSNFIYLTETLRAGVTYTLAEYITEYYPGVISGYVARYDVTTFTDGTTKQDHNIQINGTGWYLQRYTPDKDVSYFSITPGGNNNDNSVGIYPVLDISRYVVLEGDWTHLTEEDFNNLGKYKVEYKVVGKNKFDIGSSLGSYLIDGDTGSLKENVSWKAYDYTKVNPNTTYTLSEDNTVYMQYTIGLYDYQYNFVCCEIIGKTDIYSYSFTTPDNVYYCRVSHSIKVHDASVARNNIQIEEGTTATEYEPYKEYTKTFYLNSPLLEGDTIEDVNGVATHVKRYGKVVLDGSESWEKMIPNYTEDNNAYFCSRILDNLNIVQGECINDKFNIVQVWSENLEGLYVYSTTVYKLRINIDKTKLSTIDVNGFKQWLQANPTTVVYELASPIYEPISTESILCDSYVNGHLDVDSAVPVEKVVFKRMNVFGLRYVQPSTNYIFQFESDRAGHIDIFGVGGRNYNQYQNIDVVKGLNRYQITTSENTLNQGAITGIGFNASNIQVVATDRDNIGYFKGIQSSFEDKVIRNKNLFNKNNVIFNSIISQIGNIENSNIYCRTKHIECKPNTPYTCNVGTGIHYFDENKTWLSYQNHCDLSPSNAKYLMKSIRLEIDLDIVQIEEGIENTTYEEYNIYDGKYEVKVTLEDENGVISNESIYLNSPLLKGDRIEMYNGKLCHYHKMNSVVLNGNESGEWSLNTAGTIYYSSITSMLDIRKPLANNYSEYIPLYCDTRNATYVDAFYNKQLTNCIGISDSGGVGFSIDNFTSGQDIKQWLSQNPTTVVYELAEPYYEDITPIQNEFTITSIGESSFAIDSGAIPTDGEITYSVNVKLLNDLEESINNNTSSTDTDLSTILDDIINE